MGIGLSKGPILEEVNSPKSKKTQLCDFSCFRMFCPASRDNDPFGTPLPDSPSQSKKLRTMYGDLELEESDADVVQTDDILPRSKRTTNRNSPSIATYSGVDGEQKMMSKYQMCEVLGVGSTSICHRCVDRSTGKSYACKVIDKVQVEEQFQGMLDQFHTEIESLKVLQHPNIVKLYDVYTTVTKIYIVMEFMPGGELFDYITQKGTLNEAEGTFMDM
jgi:hypothetical protein